MIILFFIYIQSDFVFLSFDKWLLEYSSNNSFFFCFIKFFLSFSTSTFSISEVLISISFKNKKVSVLKLVQKLVQFLNLLLTPEFLLPKIFSLTHPISPFI